MKSMSSARGFTLIELLVVLGILSLLAALLLPVLAKSRQRAYSATCQSNLRQLGVAISLYAADYDGKIPYAAAPQQKTTANAGLPTYLGEPYDTLIKTAPDLRDVLKPYSTTNLLFRCPADHVPAWMRGGFVWPGGEKATWYEGYGSSYGYIQQRALHGQALIDFASPTKSPLMSDLCPFHNADEITNFDNFGYNVLFADMHVKTMSGKHFTFASENAVD